MTDRAFCFSGRSSSLLIEVVLLSAGGVEEPGLALWSVGAG